MSKMYECSFRLGSVRSKNPLLWVKSAEWVGDSIVIDFSPDRCFIPEDLAGVMPKLLCAAAKRREKKFTVHYGEAFECPAEETPVLKEKYQAFIREYVNVYGIDAVRNIVESFSPSEEVPGNE